MSNLVELREILTSAAEEWSHAAGAEHLGGGGESLLLGVESSDHVVRKSLDKSEDLPLGVEWRCLRRVPQLLQKADPPEDERRVHTTILDANLRGMLVALVEPVPSTPGLSGVAGRVYDVGYRGRIDPVAVSIAPAVAGDETEEIILVPNETLVKLGQLDIPNTRSVGTEMDMQAAVILSGDAVRREHLAYLLQFILHRFEMGEDPGPEFHAAGTIHTHVPVGERTARHNLLGWGTTGVVSFGCGQCGDAQLAQFPSNRGK